MRHTLSLIMVATALHAFAMAGEQTIVSLRDFSQTELKYAGITLNASTTVHIRALGGGESDQAFSGKNDQMFAYGWIINADSRQLVWQMKIDNTSRSGDDRQFDGTVTLEPGSYEVYFTAYAFSFRSPFTRISVNVDHRNSPLFGSPADHKGFFSWFKDFWSNDIDKGFRKRAPRWGIDLLVDESVSSSVGLFSPPKSFPRTISHAIGLGDNQCVRIAFEVTEPLTLHLYALGEHSSNDMTDWGWIVNLANRERVWEMDSRSVDWAGGSEKNVRFEGNVTLAKGKYLLYYVTDNSHSMADWNSAPPIDPLNYGITLTVNDPSDAGKFHQFDYDDYQNVIVSIVRVGDNEHRSAGFTLKENADVRVLAFGERSSSRSLMADYGQILNAQTRARVWTMDVDHTFHAGGAAKNRYCDEIVHLPKGSYVVTYSTDDSHSYHEWNDDPPYDPDHYGITVMGVGPQFSSSIVGKYTEARDKNIIAQLVKVGNNANLSENFTLKHATRIRVYALGEGQGREMFDYGLIQDAHSGAVVWEMTYAMTFYAGGGRKNRMVNTTILLDKGDYTLRYRSDDSHSYGDWNVDPPEDQEYWGITLYHDDGPGVTPPTPAETVPDEPPPVPPGGDDQ